MNLKKDLSKEYWPAVQVALVLQAVVLFFATMMLDGGQCLQFFGVSFLAYWGGVLVIVKRRPKTPTKLDLFLIRWSFPVICVFITPAMMMWAWKIRGVRF